MAKSKQQWREKLDELKKFFSENTIPAGPIQLYPWVSLPEPKKFIESSFTLLEAQLGNETFLPYMLRLIDLMKFIQNEQKTVATNANKSNPA